MFWNREKEIKKVLNRYGTAKGAAFLTYFYSFVVETRKLFDYGRSSSELLPALTAAILRDHNPSFFAEYGDFFVEYHANKALVDELDRSKNKYYDETVFADTSENNPPEEGGINISPVEIKDPVGFLSIKAKEIIQSRGLLNEDGTLPTVSGINYPKPFSESVMKYCTSKYVDLGDQKIRSEYIITAYYSAICATLLYKKKELRDIHKDYLFYELMSFVDMETVDVSAENLLGTKNGQPLADEIWSIISPYVRICLEVFDRVSPLSDSVILSGIRNAFKLGMLVGEKYSSGQRQSVLDLLVKEDFYRVEDPNDLDHSYVFGPVCISGRLDRGTDGLRIHLSSLRTGSANIKVLPIDAVEGQVLSQIGNESGFIETDTGIKARKTIVYGKLVNKGRWDSELQCAFTAPNSRNIKLLKSNL